MSIFEIGAILIGLSAVFGFVNHRYMQLPHTIGLVVIALAASLVVVLIELVWPQTEVSEIVTGVLTITYAVVLFSIIVQGLTIKPLVERTVSRGDVVATG